MKPDLRIRGKRRVGLLVRDPDDGAAREQMSDQRSELQRLIAERLGVLPNFFCTTASAPGLMDRLWDFARSAYFDSPLPSLFKERLFVHLSRFCEVRYCIVRHVGFLIGHGHPAGDPDCPPQTIDQVVALLRRPVPGETAFADAVHRLQEAEPTTKMPAAETQREADLFDLLSLIFLEPRQSLPARRAVCRAFGDAALEVLIAFLAFIRTAHFWTETHPELEYEPDMLLLMKEHALLAQLLLDQSEAERTWSPMERARLLSTLAAREAELRELNEGLENEVQDRTRELRAAEADLRELNEGLEREVQDRTQALLAAEDALRQSQKMEAVGQLTGGLAHDFNNMLTGVIGNLELLQTRVAQGRSSEIERYILAAQESAQRAAALTHRLLAFARRQPLDTKPSDINRIVLSMEDMLRRTLGERVQLQTILTRDLWAALADVNQFESAILNLAINARDAMPDGGRLTIETRNTRLDADYARRHNDVAAGEYVVISVSDTGIGMSPDVAERAIEPFFTTKPIGLGTGLGLSMIYGFAKQSQGHLRIYSEEGVGTTIRLYLARAYTDSDLPPIITAIETPRGEGETILVVEDDAAVRLLVTAVLEELGYSYLEASGAPEAMTILRSGARIDLLLTDVGLPIMNGRQLAEFARESRPEMKVLFVTGYAENAAVRGGFLGGGMDMLTKPFALNVLGLKIKAMIGPAT
ncbi:MAG TPA: response regulator [Acetobacteraceae bacterium]|jgi:signal transduction histidine kinase|nr:response regulator [Acetobacteraceae bacterium]